MNGGGNFWTILTVLLTEFNLRLIKLWWQLYFCFFNMVDRLSFCLCVTGTALARVSGWVREGRKIVTWLKSERILEINRCVVQIVHDVQNDIVWNIQIWYIYNFSLWRVKFEIFVFLLQFIKIYLWIWLKIINWCKLM